MPSTILHVDLMLHIYIPLPLFCYSATLHVVKVPGIIVRIQRNCMSACRCPKITCRLDPRCSGAAVSTSYVPYVIRCGTSVCPTISPTPPACEARHQRHLPLRDLPRGATASSAVSSTFLAVQLSLWILMKSSLRQQEEAIVGASEAKHRHRLRGKRTKAH